MSCHPNSDAVGSVALRDAGQGEDFKADTDSEAVHHPGMILGGLALGPELFKAGHSILDPSPNAFFLNQSARKPLLDGRI